MCFVAVFLSCFKAQAVPNCLGSPTSDYFRVEGWGNCQGTLLDSADGTKLYVGEWLAGVRHGQGTGYDGGNDGTQVRNGVWKNGLFADVKLSPLEEAFTNLPAAQRKKVQSYLEYLRFYKSSIDGLYGKGTEAALVTYNKQKLNGSDLAERGSANP